MKNYYVYMISNKRNNVLYIGVTNNLERRTYEHKNKLIDGFSKKYNCNKLVWFEHTEDIRSAILKEKQMKKWKREIKDREINKINPEWRDLSEDF
ncbi:MAG: GIY-YIG nuclease family protein [Candidatus Omnitrophica bacterium]|nr:GIY-YIG nuclease family protein [Candidatus Omnitrophota bacterium]